MHALVIQPAFLGDTVFLGPAVRALKARWPEGRVTLVVTPRGAEVARLLPGCDSVVVFDKRRADRGASGLLRTGRALRALRPDLALVPHSSPRAGLLAWLSRAPRRIGYAFGCAERLHLDRGTPFVDRALRLAERAGATGDRALQLLAPREHGGYVERILAGAGRPLLGIVPGAEWETKRWGAERYAELVRLAAGAGGTAVVLGAPAERALAERIRALAGPAVRDATGNAIAEAIALLARCDAVVGGDTGLVHCARALGVPTAVIFGPTRTDRHLFGPRDVPIALGLSCQPCHDHGPRRCPLGHHDCMARLEPARVAAALRALLDGAGHGG